MTGDRRAITVVIPTCDRPELLTRCLEAITNGAPLPSGWTSEVVVTDDGRTPLDAGMKARFPAVRWVRGPCRGPAANRNHGVRNGTGDWVAFTDDDCVPDRGWLSSYATAVRPGVELYEGPTLCRAGLHRFAEDAPVNPKGGTFPSCNLLLSRHLYDAMGGFDENFPPYAVMEDIDFRTRILEGDRPWLFVPGAVVDHPPRPRVTGRRAGARWESTVFYWAKRRGGQPYRDDLPTFVAKVRVAEMVQRHRVRDYPAALASLAAEWWYVRLHVRGWERKYSGIAQAMTSESGGRP